MKIFKPIDLLAITTRKSPSFSQALIKNNRQCFLYSYKCHGHYYMEILCFKVRKSEVKIVGHRKKKSLKIVNIYSANVCKYL